MNTNANLPKLAAVIFCWALTSIGVVLAQGAPQLSEELKVLEQFEGTWDTAAAALPAKLTPEGRRYTGRIRCELILDGQVMQGNGRFTRGDGSETDTLLLWTYDKRKKTYELAQYASSGTFNRWTGEWDAVSKSFTWRDIRDNGQIDTFTFQFKDSDTVQVTRELKDSDDTLYLFLVGEWTRKK